MSMDIIARGHSVSTRSRLASPDSGASMVGYRRPGSETAGSTLHAKATQVADLRDWIGGNWNEENDYTAEMQAAFDECDDQGGARHGGVALRLPHGKIVVSQKLLWRRHAIIGDGAVGTTIVWAGAPGETVFEMDYPVQQMRKLRLDILDGDHIPGTWVDYRSSAQHPVFDWGATFDGVFFGHASGAALKLPTVVNGYLSNCRWNNCRTMVEIQSKGTASGNCQLSIRASTIDWDNQFAFPITPVEDLVRLSSSLGSSDFYTVKLHDWRFEGDRSALADDFSILRVRHSTNALSARPVLLHMSDCSMDVRDHFATSGKTVSIVKQDTTQTNVLCPILIENVWFTGVDRFYSGSRLADQYVYIPPSVPKSDRIPFLLIDAPLGNGGADRTTVLPRKVSIGETELRSTATGFSIVPEGGSSILGGQVTPEGSVDAAKGSLYLRSSPGVGYEAYLKTSAKGTLTGWHLLSYKLAASINYDPPVIAAGGSASASVGVAGAVIGDTVLASFNRALQGMKIRAEVTAADTVTVTLENPTGASVDLGVGLLTARVVR